MRLPSENFLLPSTSNDLQQNVKQMHELERQRNELGAHCEQLAEALASAEDELALRGYYLRICMYVFSF